jgi:cytochrome c biogenesis protein CcmG, thiol:disulfide interchange protein DsbE
LTQLAQTADPKQLVLIGIDVWDNDADARAFLQQHGLTYPNGPDKNGAIAIDYGVFGVPETFFISPEGKLLGKYLGPLQSVQQVHDLTNQLGGQP